MYMYYLTNTVDNKETLIAVAGNKDDFYAIFGWDMNEYYHVRGLNYLLEKGVEIEIPNSMKWIVESDRKHQEREIESRTKNLTDENALNFEK